MNNELRSVEEFHTKFLVNLENVPCIPKERTDLRVSLIQEELNELKDAIADNNMVEVLDALVDLQYVLSGTILEFGLQHVFEDAFREVHSSNMTKLDADGNPIFREDGKVMKSELWRPPNLKQFLEGFGI